MAESGRYLAAGWHLCLLRWLYSNTYRMPSYISIRYINHSYVSTMLETRHGRASTLHAGMGLCLPLPSLQPRFLPHPIDTTLLVPRLAIICPSATSTGRMSALP